MSGSHCVVAARSVVDARSGQFAQRAGVRLAPVKRFLVSREELSVLRWRRVPSCTGCYFDLPSDGDEDEDEDEDEDNEDNADDEAHADPDDQHDTPSYLLPVPGHPGNARLLRFMSELANQWYLLLEGDAPPRVAMGYLDPKNDFRVTDLAVCADSFETFIRRFWIENLLWFRHSAGESIDGELRAYLDEARARLIGR